MHDGQYAFEKSPNTGGSWNVHNVTDRLISQKLIKEIIIVAIPNMGSERGSEYAHEEIPFTRDLKLETKGLLYEHFIINDLKPYIDRNYRTLTDSDNTALIGSSMGGLVTYNIGFRNPNVFGNLGIMSPFLVTVDYDTLEESKHYKIYPGSKPQKTWVDIGEYEGFILVRHVREFVDTMISQGLEYGKNIVYYNVPGAAHFEADWAERIYMPLIYFFGDIGTQKSVKLFGRKSAGIGGIKVQINAVAEFDSGFKMSDLSANYESSDPFVLEVADDGTIQAKKEGTATVTYKAGRIVESELYTVVHKLSEFVTAKVNVNVPENTPEDLPVKLHRFKLNKVDVGLYEGTFKLYRDSAFAYKISRGDSFVHPIVEQDKSNKDIPYRKFSAPEDIEINCDVENWKENERRPVGE
jgi:predicted alpha/beta superfamily hydrolase